MLAGLVILILGLTLAEEYAERQREQPREAEAASERTLWQGQMNTAFEQRRQELSSQLRRTLDSIASDVVATGVSRESLAAVVLDSSFPEDISSADPIAVPPQSGSTSRTVAPDGLPPAMLREYDQRAACSPVRSDRI